MRGRIKICIIVTIFVVIGGVLFSLYENKSVNDTSGGVITNKKEIVYEVKSNYKNMKIKIKTDSEKEENLKVTVIDPKKNEKVIDAKTNKEIIENFKGYKGNWIINFESKSKKPINFEINTILKNK